MHSYIKHLSVCVLAALSFQSAANPVKGGDSRFSMGLEASTKKIQSSEIGMETLGVNFGAEFGLNSLVSFKPNMTVGTGITSDNEYGYKFSMTYYATVALDARIYVPQVKGLYFHAAPTYSKYKMKSKTANQSSKGDSRGFGFQTGLGYQINDQLEVGLGFEKDYLKYDLDMKSWNLNINYLF